ncbi:MAG: DUF3769 domain-containing protein [Leptolyngbyaceae cyanobacterium]
MPYPVLPPPPPPVVTPVVSDQAESIAPVISQETSTIGHPRQPGQLAQPSDLAANVMGDRSLPPPSTSIVRAEVIPPETQIPAPPPAFLPFSTPDPITPPTSLLPSLSPNVPVGSPPSLAPPERSLPESSAWLSSQQAAATRAHPPENPERSSQVIPSNVTPDRDSDTTFDPTPYRPQSNVSSSSLNESPESFQSATVTPPSQQGTSSYPEGNVNPNLGVSGLMSRVIVPTPIDREQQIPPAVPLADISYILETFAPEQLALPSLQQLEQQHPGPAREITTFSLDLASRPTPTTTIAQGIDTTNDADEFIDSDPVESNTPLIRQPSVPIPIFVPETGQPVPTLPPPDNIDNAAPRLDEIDETTNDLLLETIPVLAPSPASDRDPVSTEGESITEGNEEANDWVDEVSPDSETEDTNDLIDEASFEGEAEEIGEDDLADEASSEGEIGDTTEAGDTETLSDDPLPNGSPPIQASEGTSDALEVTADRQIYDQERQSFLAEGNALMTFRGALLQADRLRVNLRNRVVVAQGNAVLTRGDQVIRGDRLEYDLIQDQGSVSNARGEVYIPQTTSDFSPTEQSDILSTAPDIPLSERLANEQPITTATSTGSLVIGGTLASPEGGSQTQDGLAAGTVSRIRFEAEEVIFTPDGWEATNVRLTNDPFSPPELEVRSRLVTFRRLDENRSELRARRPRAVLDQGLHIPLFRERTIFGQSDRNPAPFSIGFDEDERGGLFIERDFNLIATDDVEFTLTPQFFIQRAWENGDATDQFGTPNPDDTNSLLDPDLYGLLGSLLIDFGSKTAFEGNMEITSFDLNDVNEDDLQGSVRIRRKVMTPIGPHELTTEYSYRDRLFNGTLGFQTVQKSYGVVLTSPTIPLGESGVQLTYQGGIQQINALISFDRHDTLLNRLILEERNELELIDDLIPVNEFGRTTLTRYQLAARLQRFTFLWIGQPLPATPEAGLRYTANPVVPYIVVLPSIQGVTSFYSSGDTQTTLTGGVSLLGQFGHFSRPYLDFFGFNLGYSRSTEGADSPFLFDRAVDREVISGGVTAQLFGPIRVGFQTSLSLSETEEFDNTFILEYSRRTHGLTLRYSPDRQQGSINLRISDFDWQGTPEPFGGNPDD